MSYNYEKYIGVYEFPVFLQGINKEIKIRPLTTRDIKKILIYENEEDIIKLEEVVDIIFDNCIIDEGFNTDDLYIQDRYTLLLELRKITKGTEYQYTNECGKCRGDFIVTVNLENIKIKEKKEIDNNVPILNGNLTLKLDFITRGEQIEAYKSLKNQKLSDSEKMIEMVLLNLAQSVKSIISKEGEDTDIPLSDKLEFVQDLPRKELDTIRNWYSDNEFGADLTITEECPHCGYKEERNININNFFD